MNGQKVTKTPVTMMNRKSLVLLACATLLFAACRKDKDDDEELDLDYVLKEAQRTYDGLNKPGTTFQRLTEKIDEIVLKSLHKRKKS